MLCVRRGLRRLEIQNTNVIKPWNWVCFKDQIPSCVVCCSPPVALSWFIDAASVLKWMEPILNFSPALTVVLCLSFSHCGYKESCGESVGEKNTNWVSRRATNCTDGSKHDAISASYCYSLKPNTIRHSNTTIMQGARLTSSQLPAACATVSESFVRFGQKKREP